MTNISAGEVQKLRMETGASMMECKRALSEAKGNPKKALEILRKKGQAAAEKKAVRETKQGIVETYIHPSNKLGVLLELFCETDFVAKSDPFKELAHDLAMQIAAMSPRYLDISQVPEELINEERVIYKEQADSKLPPKIVEQVIEGKLKKRLEEICLINQPFIKNPDITIGDLIKEYIAKLGENIQVGKFIRFQI